MKKRYFNLLAIPAAAVILFCLLSGFTSQDPQDTAKSLIDQRTKLLQSFSLGEIPQREAERQLRQIEAESILIDDLAVLAEQDTLDLDRPCSVKFKDMTKKKQFFQYITYQTEIVWDMGNSTSEALYNVVIREDESGFKLTVFEPAKV